MRISSLSLKSLLVIGITLFSCGDNPTAVDTKSALLTWDNSINRTWIGPAFWANRLQDWQVKNGKLKSLFAGPNRRVFFLDRSFKGASDGDLEMSSRIKFNDQISEAQDCYAGFEIGIKGEFDDYRDSAIHGKGLKVLLNSRAKIKVLQGDSLITEFERGSESTENQFIFSVRSDSLGLSALLGDEKLSLELDQLEDSDLAGGLGILSHCESGGKINPVEFDSLRIDGSGVEMHLERSWGPILWAQHTLSEGSLYLTAQFAPIGFAESHRAYLDAFEDGQWNEVGDSEIHEDARTATFTVDDWRDEVDTDYRIRYSFTTNQGEIEEVYYEGTIRMNPIDKDEIVIAGFTGNNDIGFPNNDLVGNVEKQNPDFLFFSGDQLYERVGGFGVQRSPIEEATLDYLRKWYMYGWAYGHLMRDIPTVSITDDHDVYHGNIWGEGGKAAIGAPGYEAQDSGGYKMPPRWVRMVERTQTSNLPPPFDPNPIKQGIGTYFTNVEYGGISFAVLEDRKFKSAPKFTVPAGNIINGWPQNPDFDSKTDSDVPGAVLLGESQKNFLEQWAADWNDGTAMKVVLSQTIFANVATLPNGTRSDAIVPQLRVLNSDEYPPDDYPVQDHDSNGWPQTGRNTALKSMRKAFALHIAGDQHLASTIQYGVDVYGDASFALCVPAISNLWPRRWYPFEKSDKPLENGPRYSGDFEDGFGNKMTVHAVSNPIHSGKEPAVLHDRATGYGIAKINKDSRDFVLESWPRDADPKTDPPYEGWPVIANQLDNYGATVTRTLREITYEKGKAPVVQVVDLDDDSVLYTLRPSGTSFSAPVFDDGRYQLRIRTQGSDEWEMVEG